MKQVRTEPGPRRLPAAQRERQIVEAAAGFFAEHGLSGQMRELARELGLSHAAIFRYFPTKETLLERVYEHVYVRRWNPAWGERVRDRTMPLETRLQHFYAEYAEVVFDYVWVRIFVFSGLKGYDIAPRYLHIVRDEMIYPICAEVRAEFGLPDPGTIPLSERETEAAWALHGQVFYLAIRKFVYGWPVPEDLPRTVADAVRLFLRGAPAFFAEGVGAPGHRSVPRETEAG